MLVKRHLLNRLVLASLVVSGCLSAAPAVTVAQEAANKYATVPPENKYKDPKALKELDEPKKAALRGTYNQEAIKSYYRNITIPQLTSLGDPQEANNAATAIRNDMLLAEKMDGASLKAYNKFLFGYLNTVARGIKNQPFRPTASLNAVLIVGEMNDVPGSGRNPPQPFAGAYDFLIEMAEKGSSDGIKAAALVGLERNIRAQHAKWDDQKRNDLATKLLNFAKSPLGAGQSNESHAYLSARYLQLAQLFKHNKSAELVGFATDTLANEFTHPLLREQALAIVGRYDIPDDQKPKLVAAGRYSMRYMKERLERWNDLFNRNISATGGGGGAGAPGAGNAYGGGYAASSQMGPAGAGGGMGSYGAGPATEKKPEEKWKKQDEETRMLRRYALEIVQIMRLGLTGESKFTDKTDETYDKVEKGLLSKLPEGDERDLTKHAMTLMDELVEAINSEEIESKSDFQGKEVPTKVKNLIAIAEEYPGALDVENEAIIIETTEPAAPPAAEPAAAAATAPAAATNPTVGIEVKDPPAPAGN